MLMFTLLFQTRLIMTFLYNQRFLIEVGFIRLLFPFDQLYIIIIITQVMTLRIRSATHLMSVHLEVTFTVRKIRLVLVDTVESKLAGKNFISKI